MASTGAKIRRGRFKVVVTDYTFPDFSRYADELKHLPVDLIVPADETLEAFVAEARDADALIHEHLFLTVPVIDSLERCRVISHHGKGVDNIAVDRATERGIIIANVLDASVHEVSEHVFALLLALRRKIHEYDAAVRTGRWHVAVGEPVRRLHGSTLGLIGFGNLARHVAVKARAFGMNIVAYARHPTDALVQQYGVTFASLPEVMSTSDVVSVHLPLTPDTRAIVSRAMLARMKPDAVLVNISRGGLVDEQALVEALRSRRIAGAGLDVLVDEPPPPDHPILTLPNVLITPHCAWYSEEGRDDVERRTAREIARVLAGGRPVSWVNPDTAQAFAARFETTLALSGPQS
ncbi:MAG: C-terminal binding protein [Casimicrobiaceae bacterium]